MVGICPGGIWHGGLFSSGYMSGGYLSGGICPRTSCVTVHRCFRLSLFSSFAIGVGGLSVLCCLLEAEWPRLPRVCAGSGDFLSCLRRV